MRARILLVDSEPGFVLAVTDLLSAEGYSVEKVSDGVAGFSRAQNEPFDLLILELMLPGMSGLNICRDLRKTGSDIPILILTSRTQIVDRIVGLRLGADDYVTKPFDPLELLARVEALIRRARSGSSDFLRSQLAAEH